MTPLMMMGKTTLVPCVMSDVRSMQFNCIDLMQVVMMHVTRLCKGVNLMTRQAPPMTHRLYPFLPSITRWIVVTTLRPLCRSSSIQTINNHGHQDQLHGDTIPIAINNILQMPLED